MCRVLSECGWVVCVLLSVFYVHDRRFDISVGRRDITEGQRSGSPPNYNDSLIIHDDPSVSGTWLRVQTVDVCYPRPEYDTDRKFSITAFNVTDRMTPEESGYAFVTGGGVNKGELCLHLMSQRGLGYDFTVDIYGLYTETDV